MIPQSNAQAPAAPPPAPAAPAAPLVSSPTAVAVATDRRTLMARRDELSRQLSSVEGRREELLTELTKAPSPAVREGIEARLKLLDTRLLEIEASIASNGRALAANPRSGSNSETRDPAPGFRLGGGDMSRGLSVVSLFVLAPIAVAYARRIWRGTTAPPARDRQSEARLERIEQAVDAIAIEVERVGEAQRYQAKLLGEGTPVMPMAQRRDPVRVERDT